MTKAIKLVLSSAAMVLLMSTVSFADLQLPQPQGMLNDFAGKLSPATKQQLETLLENFRDRTGIEVAVVTVSFDDVQGYPIGEDALRLGRARDVGRKCE